MPHTLQAGQSESNWLIGDNEVKVQSARHVKKSRDCQRRYRNGWTDERMNPSNSKR